MNNTFSVVDFFLLQLNAVPRGFRDDQDYVRFAFLSILILRGADNADQDIHPDMRVTSLSPEEKFPATNKNTAYRIENTEYHSDFRHNYKNIVRENSAVG